MESRPSGRRFADRALGSNISIRQWIAASLNHNNTPWGTFGICAVLLTMGAILALASFSRADPQHLRVFGTFWVSGWAASHHLNPYAVYDRSYRFEDTLHHLRTHVSLNLSPPPLMPLFQAVALFNPENAVKVWTFASLFLFLASLVLLMIEYGGHMQRRQIIWFLLGPAAFDTLLVGQDYALLVAFVVLTWLLYEHNHDDAAGIFLGLFIAVKPNFAIWAVFLGLCGHKRATRSALLTLLAVGLPPLLFYGRNIYSLWLQVTAGDPHWIYPSDISLAGFASRLGHRAVGQIISIVLLAGTTIFVARKRPRTETASGIAMCIGLLASPLAWVSYSLFLAPVLLRKPWSTRFSLAVLPLMLPFQIAGNAMNRSLGANNIVGLFYFVPICFLLVYFMRRAAREVGLRGGPIAQTVSSTI
jgi:hypothetical protein